MTFCVELNIGELIHIFQQLDQMKVFESTASHIVQSLCSNTHSKIQTFKPTSIFYFVCLDLSSQKTIIPCLENKNLFST